MLLATLTVSAPAHEATTLIPKVSTTAVANAGVCALYAETVTAPTPVATKIADAALATNPTVFRSDEIVAELATVVRSDVETG